MKKKGIIKLSKRGLAIVIAGTIVASGITIASLLLKKKSSHIENTIGHSNVYHMMNFNVDPEDFVVLNVGDHEINGVAYQDDKMKYCNDNDISLGIIIDSTADTEDKIYDDVEYTKGLVRDYNIDFPVYLNINKIITNDDLSIEMKKKIILDFLIKCSSNNIYVGVYGTDTNLCRLKKYCEIFEYDAYVVMDKEEVSYDGTYNIIEDTKGNIRSRENLSEVIDGRLLNDSDSYVGDLKHVMAEGEDILDVSLQFGISVNGILSFNEMKREDVVTGTTIRIPSVINEETKNASNKVDTPLRGCDVSYAQGDEYDWEKVCENFDFMILRCNHGVSPDEQFENNAFNCNKYNMPMGVYCYNEYFREECGDDIELFKKQQREQANTTLELLKNKKIDYPVYLDIEHAPQVCNDNLTKEQVCEMFKIWESKMVGAGYIPGIYCNQTSYEYLKQCVDYNLEDKFEIWIAGGDQYFADKRDIDLEDVVPSSVLDNDDVHMAQSTDSCVNAGVGDANNQLDINFSKYDYSKKVINKKSEFEIKDFDKFDFVKCGNYAALIALGAGALTTTGVIAAKKIKKKKEYRH